MTYFVYMIIGAVCLGAGGLLGWILHGMVFSWKTRTFQDDLVAGDVQEEGYIEETGGA